MIKIDKIFKNVAIYAFSILMLWSLFIGALNTKVIDYNPKNFIPVDFIIWLFGVISIGIIMFLVVKQLRRKQRHIEEMILSSEVFDNTLDAIFITNDNGEIQRINKSFAKLTGYSEYEIIGQNPSILRSGYHNDYFYEIFWRELKEKGYIRHEIHNKNKNGETFISIQSITTLKNDDGTIKYFIATMHDITSRKNAEKKVQYLAHYDQLTNLPNRLLFQNQFSHAINLAKRNKTKLVLAFIDIDDFKNVNDTKGHPIGDKLLINLAEKIKTQIRTVDVVSRLGGDEFTILFENIEDGTSLLTIFDKVLKAISQEIFIDEHKIYVSASIGISMYPDDGEDIHTLIKNADTAMYKAKEDGKNCFRFYEKRMTEIALQQVEMETSILEAINNKELLVYYQPKILTLDNTIIGIEALVRWNSPKKGIISPDVFIPIAESMHIINEIDMFVLEQVCQDMKEWQKLDLKDVKVSINLSGYDIGLENIYETIISTVESHNVSPKNIEFEITETYFSEFNKKEMDTLNSLKEYGFTMSIDDFGTGYSSLNNLKKLPVNVLKIDKSFVLDMDDNEENKKLVKMIIDLAHIFSMKVIAEGVETQGHLEYLKAQGCDYIQGYLESKPLPKEEFIKYIEKKKLK